MPLSTRTRLGPHQILTSIEAGGMGEVYRASDTKLGREVAVQVLSAAFARDSMRLSRFEREPRLLRFVAPVGFALPRRMGLE